MRRKWAKPSGGKIGGAPLRLLVVEDHADTRRMLEVFLRTLGCEVRFTATFEGALAAGTQEHFDILLSDINLPDGNGWELIQRLEARERKPPHAIAVSGYGADSDLEKSRSAGFDAHLIKPVGPEELLALLQAAESKLPRRRGSRSGQG